MNKNTSPNGSYRGASHGSARDGSYGRQPRPVDARRRRTARPSSAPHRGDGPSTQSFGRVGSAAGRSRPDGGYGTVARGKGGVVNQSNNAAAARVARRLSDRTAARKADKKLSVAGRLRRTFFIIAVPSLLVVAVIVAAALAGVLLAGKPMAWLPTIIGEAWMVSNLAPVTVGAEGMAGSGVPSAVTISMIPMLPACILFIFVAVRIYGTVRKRVTLSDLLMLLGAVIVVPALLTLIAWFMLWDASQVYKLAAPSLPVAVFRAIVVHLLAFIVGMGPRLWRILLSMCGIPTDIVSGAVTATRFLGIMAACVSVILLVLSVWGWDRQTELQAQYPTLSGAGQFALVMLSLGYIPNAIVSGIGILLGSEFHMGQASFSLFGTVLVPLPPVPIAAVIPGSHASWAVGLLAIPAIVAVGVFIRAKPGFVHACAAGLSSGVLLLVLSFLAGGRVGYYGSSGPSLWLSAGLGLVWPLVLGLAVAAGFAVARYRRAELEPDTLGDAAASEYADSTAPEETAETTEAATDTEVGETTEFAEPVESTLTEEPASVTELVEVVEPAEPAEAMLEGASAVGVGTEVAACSATAGGDARGLEAMTEDLDAEQAEGIDEVLLGQNEYGGEDEEGRTQGEGKQGSEDSEKNRTTEK